MAFEIYAPVSDSNALPIVASTGGDSFVIYAPVSDTNKLPAVITIP